MKKKLLAFSFIFLFSALIMANDDEIEKRKQQIEEIEKKLKANETKINNNKNSIQSAKKNEQDIQIEIKTLNSKIAEIQKEYTEMENKYVSLLKAIGKNEASIKKSLKEIEESTYEIILNKGHYEDIVSIWDKIKKANEEQAVAEVNRLRHDLAIILSKQSSYINEVSNNKKSYEKEKAKTEQTKTLNQKEANEVNALKNDISKKRQELDKAKKEKDDAVNELKKLQAKLTSENIRIQTTNKNLIAEKQRLEAQIQKIISEALKSKEDEKKKQATIINNNKEKTDEQKRAEILALTKEYQGTGKLQIPLIGEILVKYGDEKIEGLKSNGIEIVGKLGQQIKAADTGTVIFTGTLTGLGSVIIIDHGDLVTVYGNLATVNVAKKAKVTKGQVIGTLGRDSVSKEPRLYFETRKGVVIVNPLSLL